MQKDFVGNWLDLLPRKSDIQAMFEDDASVF